MSMWTVTNGARHVTYDGAGWTADDDTDPIMREYIATPVPLGASAGVYTPTSPDDEVGVYLLAVRILGAANVTGTPPELPAAEYQPDVVY